MVLVPLRQMWEGTPRTRAFGASETRKPEFGSEVSTKFQFVSRLARDKSGVAAIEYALLASLIAIALISGAENLGNVLGKAWDDVATAVSSAISGSDDGAGGDNGGNGKGNNGNGNGNGGPNGDGGP